MVGSTVARPSESSSRRKGWKLRRISRALAAPLDSSRFLDQIASGKQSKSSKALEDLLDLCERHRLLLPILTEFEADRETLRNLYNLLIKTGAGQWAGGHYVAASALAYLTSLQFLLENAGTLPADDICILLIEYFERNDVGPVQLDLRGPADPNDPLNALWEVSQRRNREE